MKRAKWGVVLLVAILLVGGFGSCAGPQDGGEPLFPNEVVMKAEKALNKKLEQLGIENAPFEQLNKEELTQEEQDALTFIYGYSNTSDFLDHTPEFHLANIRVALKAREELPWGKIVPANQYRHFVLPLRVNNEILDNFRVEYYEELRNLVQGMTMEQAVLELNHWSHQHITYAPSDGRTSSPLATLRNALGRCGEQSTFVTAVLRTVGIPARQVYTPRWAHTDNNHAWVEAWIDGEWHYLGASEPAPVLDNAWFDAPVLRAMMLHTRAFGAYSGKEEWLGEDAVSTELNVTSNYVPTGKAEVKVLSPTGEPQEGVKVTFRIYNYAELYPVVTRTTNRLGEASVELGLGDVMVVAGNSPQEMAVGKLTVTEELSKIELTLGDYADTPSELHFKIVPPTEKVPNLNVTEEQEAENNRRMDENTAIRTAYTNTFPTKEQAVALADEMGLRGEAKSKLIELYQESRGYHREIKDFLVQAAAEGKAERAVALLGTLREKDLHDIAPLVLQQSLARDLTEQEWHDYRVVSPRVMLEHIYPCEPELEKAVATLLPQEPLTNADKAVALAKALESFHLDATYNPLRIALNPATVLKYQMGDQRSLTITLVRLLRTAKVPAVYDTTNGVVLYWSEDGKEQMLPFLEESKKEEVSAECGLTLTYTPSGYLKTPKYGPNFSVGYVDASGQLGTYGFDFDAAFDKVSGAKLLHDLNFTSTGTRLADGTVLLRMRKVECGIPSELVFDQDEQQLSVIGALDAEKLYYDLNTASEKSILSTTGRGYYLLVLGRPHHEPTDHILRDMNVLLGADGKLPLPTLVLTNGTLAPPQELINLLPQAHWGQDTQGIEEAIIAGCELSARVDKPLVVVADTFNRVVFVSQGYTIGIGERLASIIEELK